MTLQSVLIYGYTLRLNEIVLLNRTQGGSHGKRQFIIVPSTVGSTRYLPSIVGSNRYLPSSVGKTRYLPSIVGKTRYLPNV